MAKVTNLVVISDANTKADKVSIIAKLRAKEVLCPDGYLDYSFAESKESLHNSSITSVAAQADIILEVTTDCNGDLHEVSVIKDRNLNVLGNKAKYANFKEDCQRNITVEYGGERILLHYYKKDELSGKEVNSLHELLAERIVSNRPLGDFENISTTEVATLLQEIMDSFHPTPSVILSPVTYIRKQFLITECNGIVENRIKRLDEYVEHCKESDIFEFNRKKVYEQSVNLNYAPLVVVYQEKGGDHHVNKFMVVEVMKKLGLDNAVIYSNIQEAAMRKKQTNGASVVILNTTAPNIDDIPTSQQDIILTLSSHIGGYVKVYTELNKNISLRDFIIKL